MCIGWSKYTNAQTRLHTQTLDIYTYMHIHTHAAFQDGSSGNLALLGKEIPAALRQFLAPCRCYLSPSSVQLRERARLSRAHTQMRTHICTHSSSNTCKDAHIERGDGNVIRRTQLKHTNLQSLKQQIYKQMRSQCLSNTQTYVHTYSPRMHGCTGS